jgi:hypothetical protein
MKYGYVRVSSKKQDETRQIKALLNIGISKEKIFSDKSSGNKINGRENWEKLMATVVINDIIVIKELDRLGRNNQEIKETFERIGKKGVFLEFLEQPLLNTSGKSEIERELIQPLVLHLMGYFAEKERRKLKERQKEAYKNLEIDSKGRKISRKKNKIVGRPNKQENLTANQKRLIKSWIDGRIKLKDCITLTELSRATLFRIRHKEKR